MDQRILIARSAQAVDAADVPRLLLPDFQELLAGTLTAGTRVAAYYGQPSPDGAGKVLVTAVLANDREGTLGLFATEAAGAIPSLAEEFPTLQLFERELHEQHGVVPTGHPWLKPVRCEEGMGREIPFFAM